MYFLTTQDINDLARELQKTHAVYGPQVNAQTGQVFFDLLAESDLPDLEAAIPSMPVKEILFPQMERILKYSYDTQAQSVTLEKQYGEKLKVLFGLRPCDLAGIQCLDRFFLGQEFVDDVYLAHRRQSILITNTCTRPWDQCFCVCTHTGPAADEGFDLDLTRLDDGYLVQVGSEKGQALADTHGWATAERRRLAEKAAVVDRCVERFPDQAKDNKAWISRAMNRITTGFVKHEIWEYIGQQCFECGACSFVCPSCSCFNIEDVTLCGDSCERLRTRDSCSFSGYTRMAGDHNPRAPVEDRRNKRFFCKLSYTQSKKYLRPGCVGCGRCQLVCPGDIGLPNVVQYIRRETTE
ncbi:MAG: 4Fe-4S dicluster domain-containing protein [Lamprocystis purpurea]|jgi:NAD-dependent dihydropyrimidine dehydrogenase PreA subunit|uniref:4Fe-4S dicluster domain-containing protein n=1 Tax=Lamprocystis purpurea TaxID=61598 RepID=UPI000364D671|nr:4Fe-4S dicluster domain-containing protein [Lamprocystis purpurea]MBV5274887.1 4Fe-4S dicluster domain-containing protein [Lamprocystis purpurea]